MCSRTKWVIFQLVNAATFSLVIAAIARAAFPHIDSTSIVICLKLSAIPNVN